MTTRFRFLFGLTAMLMALGLASCQPVNTPILTTSAQALSTPMIESTVPREKVTPEKGTAQNRSSLILFQRDNNTWVIDANGQNPRQIASNVSPLSWSPSGKHLLLQGKKQLFIADALGSEPRLLYQDEGIYEIGAETQWLNDRIILLEIWADQFDPHIYYLDVDTGKVQRPDPDYWRILEAVSVQGQYWIQSSDNGFEIADLSGKRISILPDYNFGHTTQPAHSPNVVPLPSGEGAFFSACVSGSCNIYLAVFPDRRPGPVTAVFEWGKVGERNLSNLSVSPDGRYLAFVYGETELYFLNIASQIVEYKWPWLEDYYPAFYLWSPNSDAIIYKSWDQESGRTVVGIRKLEMTTGLSYFLFEDNSVGYLADWKYIVTP